ncbi:2-oxoglutarate dehydrogenase, E2 component, dihydrolipoamide succinyltransferase [Arthrobacter sp. A2-55]|nr:2-oxoglutarate dehydrogenase, E2 component, dihydrolipoamide succinyltransferase [Arthrobacter sp. A2-55]MCU6481193.1 2-oxoglutarate dehydrogenase, E2 component, dihydrolipoamide succinyltransferase [Arthrobacter sp. A2-55]
MPEAVLLPALGESVTEGTVTRWLKEVGDTVELDEPLLEVSTDKVDTELPSPFAGVLEAILVREDQTAEIGQVLAHIGTAVVETPAPVVEQVETPVVELGPQARGTRREPASGGSAWGRALRARRDPEVGAADRHFPATIRASAAGGLPPSFTSPTKMPAPPPPVVEQVETPASYVTPLVRRLARQHGVKLSAVTGTGVGGRIRKQDILAAASSASAAPAAAAAPAPRPAAAVVPSSLRGTTVKAPRIRQVIARRMRESLNASTQLTQVHEVDVTALVRLREASKAGFADRNGVKLTFLPFIAVAVAGALKQHPVLNAEFDEAAGTITYHGAEHLAFAVDTPKGLLVPVVRDAGTLNLAGMARGIADVAARTRAGSIGADELSGGTFSITNIGSVGALFDTPIINQPQVGILGVGAIVKRPGVVTDRDGADVLGIRHKMYLCLTYDHRLVDGADAGRFLQAVTRRLEAADFDA